MGLINHKFRDKLNNLPSAIRPTHLDELPTGSEYSSRSALTIGAGKRGNMHRPGHFAADSLESDRLLARLAERRVAGGFTLLRG